MCRDNSYNADMPLVSILLAAYNEEEYIARCLHSVCNQTYENIEIIIVDDGSIDKTYEICSRLKKRDKRIKVIYQEHAGLPMARQAGLKVAKGKYIQFIDCDDWCELDRTKKMVDRILSDETDIVFSSAYRHREDGIATICNLPVEEGTYSVEEIKNIYTITLFGDLKNDKIVTTGYVWCCMYKRSCLRNIIFYKEIVLHEDEIIMLQALSNAEKISVSSDKLYHYNRRMNTLSKKNVYWSGFWENIACMYNAKKDIGEKIYGAKIDYKQRLATSIYQKYLRSIRNETHYTNPSHFWGGLRRLYQFDAKGILDDAEEFVLWEEFTNIEIFLIKCVRLKLLFVPYFYYAIKTNRMRKFQEKTKN